MRTTLLWSERFKDRDGVDVIVTDVTFHPEGSQLIVSAGTKIYVYSAHDGNLIQTLKGHKDNILSLCYSKDGKRFASGSADKQVIIWTSKLEGMLKFSHNEPVRCMEFNPLTNQLASCTASDFGLWSPEHKSVSKHKVTGQINACSWSHDGHYLALALNSGHVSVRNRSGDEKLKIERFGIANSPVSGICFSPAHEDDIDVMCTIDWNQTVAFYDMTGKQIGKERTLDFEPLSVEYFNNGEYLLMSGSNRQALMYTKDGILINNICELSSWIWKCKANPNGTHVAVCSQDGIFAVYDIIYSTVHSLYKERYAYRDGMTDVIIQHLISDEKVRIKCRDIVKKLAIYKNRLAIQLSDKIVIYELFNGKEAGSKGNSNSMQYQVKDKINKKVECTLLVVGANSVILCQEKRLQCLSFDGTMEREWLMDAHIRYIRPTGGPPGKEGLLIGLKSGHIVQIFINNPFPIPIVQISTAVRCLDLNTNRTKLAVVDDKGNCLVYNVKSKKLIYQESSANSVAWNSQFEEMLSFTGGGFLCIKAANFDTYQQQLQGFVVGFCGAKVFCLQFNTVTTIEISQSAPMHQYMDKKMFKEAYLTACLKVTDYDWDQLAECALENMQLQVSKKAFSRTSDWLHLDLIQCYVEDVSSNKNKSTELSFLGDVMAYKNHFNEAAKLYKQAGHDDKAINMYTDLRMFDSAQELIRAGDGQFKKQLAMKKADWVHNINEPRAAAEMYLSAGETRKAIEIIGQHGWIDMLMNVVRQLDKGDRDGLTLCADYLIKHKQYFNASEVFKKTGDVQKLATIYVKSLQWEEAFKLVAQYQELKGDVYVPYATWLAENERFVEAQQAFHKAGKVKEALLVLEELNSNAINEHRFSDAGYYCWILSLQCLELANEAEKAEKRASYLAKYDGLQRKADIYYAYHNIYRYIEEPFTSFFPDALFNMARFLFHGIMTDTPLGVSKVAVLYALAKQGRTLGAYKLARLVYEKLHTMHIPSRYRTSIEIGALTIRAKPFSDAEDLLPLCYRCSSTNPLYNGNQGNKCVNCKQPFILSYATFDVLPVVEFELEEGIEEDEALLLIQLEESPEITSSVKSTAPARQWEEEATSNMQSLKLDDDTDFFDNTSQFLGDGVKTGHKDDQFMIGMASNFEQGSVEYSPIIVNRLILKQMNPSEVIVARKPAPLKMQFFKNLVPEMHITMCNSCNKFFHSDEFETHVLQKSCCPFCRSNQQTQLQLH